MNTRFDPGPGASQYRYRFGTAEFDEARLDLRVGGLRVDVEQRPLQVLLALLRRAGEVVTKEELFDEVWSGRATVENVLTNAVTKLRRSLGVSDAERIQTVPRAGYRIDGPIERIAVGRRLDSRLDLNVGNLVPGRLNFQLEKQLGPSRASEVWLARHTKTAERRVYKFSTDGARLAVLKREATLFRVLNESLSEKIRHCTDSGLEFRHSAVFFGVRLWRPEFERLVQIRRRPVGVDPRREFLVRG